MKDKKYKHLLLTHSQMHDKYQELHGKKFVYPYFYKIEKNKQVIYFVGPHHSYNPKDPQHKKTQQYWDEFLKKTKKINCTSLTEGGKRQVSGSKEEAIKKDGEAGLITYLSFEENIRNISPEPTWRYLTDKLLQSYTKEDIIFHFFNTRTGQWNRLTDKPNYESYIQNSVNEYFIPLNWREQDYSLQHLIKIFEKRTKTNFNKFNNELFDKVSSPYTSELAQESNNIRDNFLLKTILKLWSQEKNVFITYGSSHAIILEKALHKLLQ